MAKPAEYPENGPNRLSLDRFSPTTWNTLKSMAGKLAEIPLPILPDSGGSDSKDREPRTPTAPAPLSGGMAIDLPESPDSI